MDIMAEAMMPDPASAAALLEPPPDRKPREAKRKTWRPKLGPIGTKIIQTRSVLGRPQDVLVKLLYGERGSLKTGIGLHDLVVHCYDDVAPPTVTKIQPLAIICTIFRSAATEGGAWEKLHSLVLPEWYDGIGLEFTEPKQDDQKNRYCFIGNKYGGWSRVILKSIPYGENIKARLKGIEPSYFLSDEVTEQTDPQYFFAPLQQLRRPTKGPRIFFGACNPADTGEEHWVWKNFVTTPCKTIGNEDGPEIPDGGGRLLGLDEQFQVFHVPLSENVHWTEEEKKAYQNTLLAEARQDASAVDRLIYGKWTPRPTGDGLFKEYFRPSFHIRGDAAKGVGLIPVKGYPIICGYDLGQVNSCVTFLQRVNTKTGSFWMVIDEIDRLRKRILYANLAKDVVARMRYWRTLTGYPFRFMHITDESAINQWRPGSTDGSYDALVFEREFNRISSEFGVMKLIGCPKGAGSISGRVQMVQSKLFQEELFVSATCKGTKDMLMFIPADKKNPENPLESSKFTHKFDSFTYPIWKLEIGGDERLNLSTEEVAPQLISCGAS